MAGTDIEMIEFVPPIEDQDLSKSAGDVGASENVDQDPTKLAGDVGASESAQTFIPPSNAGFLKRTLNRVQSYLGVDVKSPDPVSEPPPNVNEDVESNKTLKPKTQPKPEGWFPNNPRTMAYFLTIIPIVVAGIAGIATGASTDNSCTMVSNASMKSYTLSFSVLLLVLGAVLGFSAYSGNSSDGAAIVSTIISIALLGMVVVALAEYFGMSDDKRNECQDGRAWSNIMFFILIFVSLVAIAGTAYLEGPVLYKLLLVERQVADNDNAEGLQTV